MEIQWFSKNFKGVVTIYETNITLNTVASTHFANSYATLIGYNRNDNTLVIKSLNKEEAVSGVYNKNDMHPITIKPSYGRINGKNIVRSISHFYPLDFKNKTMYKFDCSWDEVSKSLIIYLKEVIN